MRVSADGDLLELMASFCPSLPIPGLTEDNTEEEEDSREPDMPTFESAVNNKKAIFDIN